jgi:hypothetical protein
MPINSIYKLGYLGLRPMTVDHGKLTGIGISGLESGGTAAAAQQHDVMTRSCEYEGFAAQSRRLNRT